MGLSVCIRFDSLIRVDSSPFVRILVLLVYTVRDVVKQ